MQWSHAVNSNVPMNYWFYLVTKYSLRFDSLVNWSHSGLTDRLFHTTASAQSRRAWHAANHIICGVLNKLCWGSGARPWDANQVVRQVGISPNENGTRNEILQRISKFSQLGLQGTFDTSFMVACWAIPEKKISLLQISTNQPNALSLQVSLTFLLLRIHYICAFSLNKRSSSLKIYVHDLYGSPGNSLALDDVSNWKHFPRYWTFVQEMHWSPVNSPYKGKWRGALMYSWICACINVWVNDCVAGDWRRHRAHYYVIVMYESDWVWKLMLPVITRTKCLNPIKCMSIAWTRHLKSPTISMFVWKLVRLTMKKHKNSAGLTHCVTEGKVSIS